MGSRPKIASLEATAFIAREFSEKKTLKQPQTCATPFQERHNRKAMLRGMFLEATYISILLQIHHSPLISSRLREPCPNHARWRNEKSGVSALLRLPMAEY